MEQINEPLEPKKLTVDFMGETVTFEERSTRDVFKYMSYGEEDDGGDSNADLYIKNITLACVVIEDSLKTFIAGLPYLKRRKAVKKFSRANLLKELSPMRIIRTSNMLLDKLEGVKIQIPGEAKLDDSKKKIPSQSQQPSQSPSSERPTGSH